VKTCRDCGKPKPAPSFLAGKAKRISSSCAPCRKARAKKHVRSYFAKLPPDQRHTITQRKRAQDYGVEHEPYLRSAIMARWGYICAYGDENPAEHLDHVVPLSKGGGDVEHNMLPACAACNLSKGAKTLAQWAETFGKSP